MTTFNDTLLRAARGEKISHTPVWYMRQAGRSQPEYRKIKETHSLEQITHDPELCAYVTELPVAQYDVDAAILYKDIVTPLPGMGIDVKIKSGVGPVISNPIRSVQDVVNLGELSPEDDIPYVLETIKILTEEKLNVPLIGFAGAPFTLASYMIEGGPSKGYHLTKSFMKNEPEAWYLLMDKLEHMTVTYIRAQVAAGAKAFQIFDSWVGALSVEDYRIFVKPTMTRIFAVLRELDVPMITFGVGAGHLMEDWNELPIDVLGLDWRSTIKEAEARGVQRPVQGNLDPSLLLADWPIIERAAKKIIEQGVEHGENGSHIFNLGHGVFPSVNPDTLKRLTAFIHEYSAQLRNA